MLKSARKASLLTNELSQFFPRKRDLTPTQRQMISSWRLDQAAVIGQWLCGVGVILSCLAAVVALRIFEGQTQQFIVGELIIFALLAGFFAVMLAGKNFSSLVAIQIGGGLLGFFGIFCQASWLFLSLMQTARNPMAEAVAGVIYASGGFFLALGGLTVGMVMPFLMAVHGILGIWIWNYQGAESLSHWTAILGGVDFFAAIIFLFIILQTNELALINQTARELIIQNDELSLRNIEKELQFAQIIHGSMTPPPEQQVFGGFKIHTFRTTSGFLSGNWVASRSCGTDSLLIAVGDTGCKGVQAAMIVQSVQTLWARYAGRTQDDVALFLRAVGQSLYILGQQQQKLTMTMALLLIKDDEIRYYSAGHSPLVMIRDGDVKLFNANGQILGKDPNPQFEPVIMPRAQLDGNNVTLLMGTETALPWSRRARPQQLLDLIDNLRHMGPQALKFSDEQQDQVLMMISSRRALQRVA